MKIMLLPADTYIVLNQTVLCDSDKKILINLYGPIIGTIATNLYLILWNDLDRCENLSIELNHHHLITMLRCNMDTLIKARKTLEAVGLIKSYVKLKDNINSYLYELYSPLSAHEFFNHPVLNILLLNNVGSFEYNDLMNFYKKINFKKSDYKEITTTMNQTFEITDKEINDEIKKQNKLGLNIENRIDFDLIINSLPNGLVNEKTFNKKNRELINQLSYVYNVDTMKMSDMILSSLDDIGLLNKETLIKTVRKNYEFNSNGKLPNIVYKTQPEYLKTPTGNNSNRSKMIAVFENTKPYDFLRFKNKGAKPSTRDLELIEEIALNYNLKAGVINVLIDYAIRMNDGKLNKKYLESIAATWSRKNIKTVEEAMDALSKNHKKIIKEIKPKKEVNVPSWINNNEEKEEMSETELEELQKMFEGFR